MNKGNKTYHEIIQVAKNKLEVLKNRYAEVFDFIVYSAISMTDVALCTITLYEDDKAFVISTNDDSIKKIWPLPKSYCSRIHEKIDDQNQMIPIHKASNLKVAFSTAFPITGSDGRVVGSLNIFDTKERELTANEIEYLNKSIIQIDRWVKTKEKEQRLSNQDYLFELSGDLMGVFSTEGSFLKINSAFSKVLGWTEEELTSSSFLEFIHKDDIEKTKEAFKNLDLGMPLQNFTNRYHTKYKTVKWIEWTSSPDLETGQVFTIGRDVTKNIEKQELLVQSELKFRNLFENISGILSVLDLEGNFIDLNRAGLDASGFTLEEIRKSSLYDLVPPARQENIEPYLKSLRKEGRASGEMNITKKDGTRAIWFFTSVIDEDAAGNKQIIANSVDITERKRLENDLLKAKEAAEEAFLAKSEFVANMSHEIRTPLNGIIGFTELALGTNLDETQKQYLEIINQSGVSLYSIINDILDFSKMEKNHMKLDIDKVDIEEIVSEAFNIVSYGVNKKGLEMLIDIDQTIPRYIWADGMRLKQIFVNLLGNALKFTEKGEIKVFAKVLEKLEDNKMLLRFGVRDTGIGIHKDKQKEIFDAFSQEDASITKRFGGTGLGLTISNKLLALSDSKLQLESEQGKGSSFFFDIIFETEEEEFETSLDTIKSVLIVDDNDNNRTILKRMLELKGIEVTEVDSGLKAIVTLMDKNRFDVIIMDYHMPVMDGIETIRKIKEMNEASPFIVLYSSSDDETLQEACDELDVDNRLVKPIRMNLMYKVLSSLKNEMEVTPNLMEPEKTSIEKKHRCMKILVAEDNAINMHLTKIYLNDIVPDCIIIEAANGNEAIEQYKKEQPDLIFMDIQMPALNGIEATKIIRTLEQDIEIPIIALTAGTLPGEKEKCLQAGMNDFLAKPLLKQTMINMLVKWIGIRETDS